MKVKRKDPIAEAKKTLSELSVRTPPVPVADIARHLGADVRYKTVKRGISGFIYREKSGSVVIGINSYHHLNRQRFTLAHELGHLCLHSGTELFVDHVPRFRDVKSAKAAQSAEIEANLFASELLMPEDFLLGDIQVMEDDLVTREAIGTLAKRYKVSPEAMRVRLERLRGVRFDV